MVTNLAKTALHSGATVRMSARLMRRANLFGDFLAVAHEGSIRQAAHKIAISQSALTRRIQELEEQVGASLFERTAHGMVLTAFGEALKHHAELVAMTCDYASNEINELLQGDSGKLRISTGPAWAFTMVPDAVATMHRQHPNIRVHLLDLMNDQFLPMLSSGELDVVVGGLPPDMARDPQFEYETLLEMEYRVFCNSRHPLAKNRFIKPTDLRRFPWIWFTESLAARDQLDNYFQRHRLPAPITLVEASSAQLAFRLLQQGSYLVLLPSTSLELANQYGAGVLNLQMPFGRYKSGLIYRPSITRLKAFTAFRQALIAQLPTQRTLV